MKLAMVVMMFIFAAHSHAEENSAIVLKPFAGEQKLHVTNVLNIYGKCGEAVVAVLGVEADEFDNHRYFKIDQAGNSDIQLRTGGKDISYRDILSDFNLVQCVPSKAGPRLLVGSHCGGSVCGDSYDFYIIDPKNGVFLSNKNSKKSCDAECASKILGNDIPMNF